MGLEEKWGIGNTPGMMGEKGHRKEEKKRMRKWN